jgi:hypothetical protein
MVEVFVVLECMLQLQWGCGREDLDGMPCVPCCSRSWYIAGVQFVQSMPRSWKALHDSRWATADQYNTVADTCNNPSSHRKGLDPATTCASTDACLGFS